MHRTIALGGLCCAAALLGASAQPEAGGPYARLVTDATRANPGALAALERPGTVLFSDGFEGDDPLASYFEVRGDEDGRAIIDDATGVAHTGERALRLTAPDRGGSSSGAGASYWIPDAKDAEPDGYERIHLRAYVKFDDAYDQGNLNHTGTGLAGTSGDSRWSGMGKAGVKPTGDDRFTSGFEAWRDWKRLEAPGYMFCYVYWMDMRRDRDGNFWGNMLGPKPEGRIVPERGRWYCFEQMIKTNTIKDGVPQADGELAAWIDGELYLHYTGMRWRSDERVRIKRFGLDVYIHSAERDNPAWYDDVVLSTGYIGPVERTPGDAP